MRIISTFNDSMYESTGEGMLKTVEKFLPEANIFIYEELNKNKLKYPSVKVIDVPEFQEVYEKHNKLIPPKFGGTAEVIHGEKWWNKRWFGWFMKVLMAHDAICNKNLDGFVVFVDSDIRFMKNFNDNTLTRLTNKKPISFFKGTRAEIESGLVVVDANRKESAEFYDRFMNLFISGEFKKHNRWDDIWLMTQLIYFRDGKKVQPEECFNDFAQGKNTTHHTNSNQWKTNQIINSTEWNEYVEHDKGVHSIKKVL